MHVCECCEKNETFLDTTNSKIAHRMSLSMIIDDRHQRRGSPKKKSYCINRTVKSGKSTSKSISISMSDNDSRKSSTGIIASESSSRASSPNTSRGDVVDDDDDNKSIHSEVDYKDVELAPLITPKNKDDDNADTAADESGLLVDPHKNRNTSEWISFIVKKNGKVLSTCLSYSFCSVSMVLVNKSLASRYVTSDRGYLIALIAFIDCIYTALHKND